MTTQHKQLALATAINVSRLLVAAVFIFSGYVKAVDPLGTQYRINDYVAAVGLAGKVAQWMTLAMSISLSAVEFCLGIFLLFAIRRRLTSKLLVAFMVVMTLVSVWLAGWNPIKDCGCFGDAIHLTNAQTLAKNIVLLALSSLIAYRPLKMMRFISKTNQWIVTNYAILFIVGTSAISLRYLPLFDFRPYHIGANIPKEMEIPKGAKQPKFDTTFILEKDGVRKEFTIDQYPDSTWTFIDSKTVMTEEGFVPRISDLSITNEKTGNDVTDSIVRHKGYIFVLVAPHLEYADDANFGDIDRISEYCKDNNIPFVGLTASNDKGIAHWRDLTGAEYPFYTCDETVLRTMIRSNPGLILLKDGTILNKWSHNALPAAEEFQAPIARAAIGQISKQSIADRVLLIVMWFVLPLALLTLADRLWSWTKWLRLRKKQKKENSYNTKQELLTEKENEKENCCRQLENE